MHVALSTVIDAEEPHQSFGRIDLPAALVLDLLHLPAGTT